ncbi:MAG: hypothetical protein EZS28_032784 [Streblomastix strix]|uniref:EF-hand domain-containing protein n=1 Tax=Streblomastix strix TaxID=222440 RepID=A0A5J4UNX8_9EUKA|nr:MAG: hypothetical protein EZS28_032784 [Streblomastix strix]
MKAIFGNLMQDNEYAAVFHYVDEHDGKLSDSVGYDQKIGIQSQQGQRNQEIEQNRTDIVDYRAFLNDLSGPLSSYRRDVIIRSFKIADSDNDGIITFDDIRQCYVPQQVTGALSATASIRDLRRPGTSSQANRNYGGRVTFDRFGDNGSITSSLNSSYNSIGSSNQSGGSSDGLKKFLANFNENTQQVSMDQFVEFYAMVSAGVPEDPHFQLLMYSSWRKQRARKKRDDF